MQLIHEHDDAARGRLYELRSNQMMLDRAYMELGRQPLTIPPNPAQGDGMGAGVLWRTSTWGLSIVDRDNVTKYFPNRHEQYNIQVDPPITPNIPTAADLLTVGEAVGNSEAVRAGVATAVLAEVKPEMDSIDDDIGAVSRQIQELPIDNLINETTSMYNVPLSTATPNIFTGCLLYTSPSPRD